MMTPPLSNTAIPDTASALLAMLGAQPIDDALVLGQSGPGFTPTQCASLTAWRVQQAYLTLLAVAPVWAALLQKKEHVTEVLRAFSAHPWLPLLQKLLPDWHDAVHAAATTEPDLQHALRCWQQLHDRHWLALNLPPVVPPFFSSSLSEPLLPTTDLPRSWQQALRHVAQCAGRISAQIMQHPVAAEPGARQTIWQREGATLYRYPASRGAQPLLLIYAWINSSDVLDLAPAQSLIAALQAQGLAVWLLDWTQAGALGPDLHRYVVGHLGDAVDTVRQREQRDCISLLGICQGGTLALSYAALRPQQIASLSLAVTPVDFHREQDRLSAWAKPLPATGFACLQTHSPAALTLAFLQLKPYSLRLGKYLSLLLQAPDASLTAVFPTPEMLSSFLRMEHWLMSGPLLSGPGLAEYLDRYYHQNSLCRNTLAIAGESVRLERVSMPVQLLIAEHDHIVPPASSLALCGCLPKPAEVERFATGHIGLLVGRARHAMAEKVARFIERSAEQK